MKNSWDTIGNRTHNLLACSSVSFNLSAVPSVRLESSTMKNFESCEFDFDWLKVFFYFLITKTVETISFLPYSLTPHSTVLEKLTGLQLVKKFPAFYGTRRFITTFTHARHLFLSYPTS
jgi:hypothetical protein